jgi:hypothetical protein
MFREFLNYVLLIHIMMIAKLEGLFYRIKVTLRDDKFGIFHSK